MNTRTRTATAAAAAAAAASTTSTPAAPQVIIGKDKADFDTGDVDMGVHDVSIELGAELSLEEMRDQLNAGIGAVDMPQFAGHLETLAFMEERVLVRVHETTEPHAEKFIEVYNDGKLQIFVRGEWIIAKRKYVEVLARAKPFSVTTPEAVDGRGNATRRIDRHVGQRYQFEMRDKNPKGAAWLNAIMMEQ